MHAGQLSGLSRAAELLALGGWYFQCANSVVILSEDAVRIANGIGVEGPLSI